MAHTSDIAKLAFGFALLWEDKSSVVATDANAPRRSVNFVKSRANERESACLNSCSECSRDSTRLISWEKIIIGPGSTSAASAFCVFCEVCVRLKIIPEAVFVFVFVFVAPSAHRAPRGASYAIASDEMRFSEKHFIYPCFRDLASAMVTPSPPTRCASARSPRRPPS